MPKSKKETGLSLATWLTVAGALAAAAGCGAEDATGTDDVSVAEFALGESACGTNHPDVGLSGGFNYTSPQTYSAPGCWRGFIHDAYNVTSTAQPTVKWADLTVGASGCRQTIVAGYLYGEDAAGNWEPLEILSAYGRWVTTTRTDHCKMPQITFKTPLAAGASYRIVATGRVSLSGATRKIRISN